jgi:hypothetical protein
MTSPIETTIYTQEDVRIGVDQWNEDSVWLSLQGRSASMHTTLTRAEAEQLLANLQSVLAQEVV